MRSILALDMATKTGWAYRGRDGSVISGVQKFELRRGESSGMRLVRFRKWVAELLSDSAVDLIAYEQPIAYPGRANAARVGFNLEGVLLALIGSMEGLDYTNVTPSELKKHATGRGNANKDLMKQAAFNRWQKVPADDNEADALCLLAWAIDETE